MVFLRLRSAATYMNPINYFPIHGLSLKKVLIPLALALELSLSLPQPTLLSILVQFNAFWNPASLKENVCSSSSFQTLVGVCWEGSWCKNHNIKELYNKCHNSHDVTLKIDWDLFFLSFRSICCNLLHFVMNEECPNDCAWRGPQFWDLNFIRVSETQIPTGNEKFKFYQ